MSSGYTSLFRDDTNKYSTQSLLNPTFLYRKTVVVGQIITTLADVQFEPTATARSNDWSFGASAPFVATYTGSISKKLLVNVSANVLRGTLDSNVLVGLYVNDVMIDSKATRVVGASEVDVISFSCIIQISNGQTLKVKALSSTNAEITPITLGSETSVACSITAVDTFAV